MEILGIPFYFYVIMYALFQALEFDNHISCIHGTYPLDQVIVELDLIIFSFWICANPLFMIISNIFGYNS